MELSLHDVLEQRGFLHQFTDPAVFPLLDEGKKNFYFGVDLSADSMHLGNFVALMMAIHIMRRGNKCFLLVGGATSTIGNPSGKDVARPILSKQQLIHNQNSIAEQFSKLCDNITQETGSELDFEIVNNSNFYENMNVIDYLRDVGRYITVNWMISKDIVKRRVNDPSQSISYAEFSYMLIMGYDFYYLHNNHNVIAQVGGSDEWDGILSGIELVHKKNNNTVYGITNKLITDSSGKKFGKSEGNAVWLNSTKTTPYQMYQYFYNQSDEDVEKFLKLFTFESFSSITSIVDTHNKQPNLRYGQHKLGRNVCRLLYGKEVANAAVHTSDLVFSNKASQILQKLSNQQKNAIHKNIGGSNLLSDTSIVDAIVLSGLAASKNTARKLVSHNAISVNDQKVSDLNTILTKENAINNCFLLKKGKRDVRLIRFT